MKYTEVGVVEDDSHSPNLMETTRVDADSFFAEAVRDLVRHEAKRDYILSSDEVLMTVESCWSGYSEFTITQTWTEVVLTVPAWNWEKSWSSLPEFFEHLAKTSTDRGGDA